MQSKISSSSILAFTLCVIFSLIGCSNSDTSAKLQSQLEAQSTQIAELQQGKAVAFPSPTSAQTVQIQNAVETKPTQQPKPTDTAIPFATATAIPTPTAMPIPTKTFVPPSATPTAVPPTQVPQVPKDENQFKGYSGNKYGTIAGIALVIKNIAVRNEQSFHSVDIELDDHNATDVFAKQTKQDALAYGRNLLGDTIAYFGGQECSAYVHSIWYPSSLSSYMFDKEWFYVGDYSTHQNGYYLSQTYVKAYYIGGSKDVQVWNYK